MSDGVFISDRPQLAIARQTVSFASLGLNDPTLTRIIYEVGNPYLSYVPTDEFNPIAGITEGKSYLLYLNAFFDGSPALANAVLTNLIPQTSTNVFAGERAVFLCTASVSFATAGINATNTNLITLVSEGYFTSYDPNDTINGIDSFVEGELYDIDPITDIDLHLYGVTKIRYSDEVLYLDSLEDVVVTNSNPDATLPLAEEEVLVRNLTTGVWENKPVSDLPTGTSYTDADARAAISLTTTGTSGAATYNNSTGVLNVPQYADTNTNIYNTDGTLAGNRTITGNNKYLALTGGRWEEAKGADVAAANDLTLGNDGNTFAITGNTQINAITNTNWQAGSRVILLFTGSPTIKHNTAGGAGTSKIILSGSADYTAATDDVLVLFYDGTNWHETTRKIAATGGGKGFTTATNGLTAVNPTTVRLGGTLTQDTTITAGTNKLNNTSTFSDGGSNSAFNFDNTLNTSALTVGLKATVTGSNSSSAAIIASGSGVTQGLQASSTSGNGVKATSSSGNAINARSTSGTGANIQSDTSIPIVASNFSASGTGGISTMLRLSRDKSGSAANGIGGAIEFTIKSSDTFGYTTGKLISYWKDVTTASRKGALGKVVVYNGTEVTTDETCSGYLVTTNATPAVMSTVPIDDETCGIIEVYIVARHNTTSGMVVGKKIMSYIKDGGTLTLGTATTVLADEITGSCIGSSYSISVVSNQLSISVTGVAATTINWKATINIIPNS